MTYDTLIRHLRRISADGTEYSYERRAIEADSEDEVFGKAHIGCNDAIVCIESYHGLGSMPFSVDSGQLEFLSGAIRPDHGVDDSEKRCG